MYACMRVCMHACQHMNNIVGGCCLAYMFAIDVTSRFEVSSCIPTHTQAEVEAKASIHEIYCHGNMNERRAYCRRATTVAKIVPVYACHVGIKERDVHCA